VQNIIETSFSAILITWILRPNTHPLVSARHQREGSFFGHVTPLNKSLKPTVTRFTLFADKANPAPRYGGLVPPFYDQ
jgi:hypothetical protein